MKKGSATLFAVVAMVITGIIFSFVFSRTANSHINNLSSFNKIKAVYEQDLLDSNENDNIPYDSINSQIYSDILNEYLGG